MILLFSIPAIGWIICLVMAFASKNQNRRNFSRATLVFLIAGLILAVVLFLILQWAWIAVSANLDQLISGATGGITSELDGFKDFADFLKGFGEIDLSSLPQQ